MNSRGDRNLIATAALVVMLVFPGPSLLAQVKVKTASTAFTVVGRHGRTDEVPGGRRFRAEAFETLEIRGLVRTPASAVPKRQSIQRLAVHFRTSPSGPHLISVAICNGANCLKKFDTHLEGDYTTRETTKPDVIANVWAFNPPVQVDSQSAVVLEVQFPGGFEGNRHPGEFVRTSIEADFPLDIRGGTSTVRDPNVVTSLGRHPSSTPGAGRSPTSIWPNGKAYLFKGSEYVRYDAKADKADPGYPAPIAGNWPGFPPDFAAGVDAEVVWGNGKVYFFKGDQYLRYDIAADKVDPGYPVPIAGSWHGLWEDNIDAGVVWPNGKAYFFKGNQYIRYDIATDKADLGYPTAIQSGWPGFPPSFAAGVDDAVVWNNGKAYFFKGSEYIRYDIATDKTDAGYPLPIAGHWTGLWP